MPFDRPSLEALVERTESDLQTRLGMTGSLLRRSVVAVFARVWAGLAHLLHGHIAYLVQQILPDTSELEFLERQASLHGLTRAAATFAGGDVTFTGVDGSIIPEGVVVLRADGARYITEAEATVASGEATVAVTAQAAGVAGNADSGATLTLESPIAGVDNTATVETDGLVGGTDQESDAALRARLLARLREPPHGGAAADYVMWAKEVAGVTRAWVYPEELGAGTVTVRFVRDNDASIIPDAGEVAAVQAYINERRPVTASVTVVAPVATPVVFTITLDPDTSETRDAVEAELVDLLERVAEPGGTILRSQVLIAVGLAQGVEDFTVSVPSADVTHTTGQMPVLGTITWL